MPPRWADGVSPRLCALALVGINPALLYGQASRSTLSLAGLKAPVHVYRDTLGIPHIYASSSQDAYFALGYLHATDRLFEMEMFRRRASGTLAEVFGKASLDDDIFVRQIGIRRSTEAARKIGGVVEQFLHSLPAFWLHIRFQCAVWSWCIG